jgi:hypothetical protein
MVVAATGSMLVAVVVAGAGITVGMVVRAAFSMFVLVTGLGSVVVRAACAVLMVVFSGSLCGVDGRVRQGGNKA